MNQIHLAGKIEVRRRHAHALAGMRAKSRFDRGIAKSAIAVVEEQLIGSGLVHLGMAILAMPIALANRLVVEIPFQIVDDDQIEQAVVVHVDPGRRYRPKRPILWIGLVQPRLRRNIGESSVAVVVVQRVAIHARHKNIFVSVIVVVADGDADVVTGSRQPGLLGYVSEMSVAVILKQAVGIFRGGFLERLDVGSVGEENIELAVVVVIEAQPQPPAMVSGAWRSGRLVAVELEIDRLKGEADRAPLVADAPP